MTQTANTDFAFHEGATYKATSICDSECHWYFTITRRTASSIWTVIDGQEVRRSVKSFTCRMTTEEYFMPFGTYSMAASCGASDDFSHEF